MGDIATVVLVLVVLQVFVPLIQQQIRAYRRQSTMKQLENRRGSRVITLIHRQETMSLLGFPVRRYIDIEDSEQVLRAIRLTRDEMPIDLVLHTPGGLVLASEQIATALRRHTGKVTVFVPHYAMSGGTLVALAADEVVMDPDAVLSPVDPQLSSGQKAYPAASVLSALDEPNDYREDETLILGDVARKAIAQVQESVFDLVRERLPDDRARALAVALSEGRWTHDFPIRPEMARELGLPVSEEMPDEIYSLMDLYPQSGRRRPSVEFIPSPYPASRLDERSW